MRRRAVVVCLLLALGVAGCFRTRYVNLHPQLPSPTHSAADVDPIEPQYWRHFWVWGWAPSEQVIHASGECGGTEHVERIETEEKFVQGLIAAVAGYYVNIYSPYSGRVICDHSVAK